MPIKRDLVLLIINTLLYSIPGPLAQKSWSLHPLRCRKAEEGWKAAILSPEERPESPSNPQGPLRPRPALSNNNRHPAALCTPPERNVNNLNNKINE